MAQVKPTIVQVRGPCNAPPDPADRRALRAWAAVAGLSIKQTA